MKGLFVRNEGNPLTDGLWVTPEMTEKGQKAQADGDYKYHSPEIIWEDGGIEDATAGKFIMGPLIVGDALLHVPALGEATAMYTSQTLGETMTTETNVTVPQSLLDRLLALLPGSAPSPAPVTPASPPPTDEVTDALKAKVLAGVGFEALKQERDAFAAKLQAVEAKEAHTALVSQITGELQKADKFGATYVELATATQAAEMLAGMNDEQRNWVMRNFAAFTAQIDASKIRGELGTRAEGDESKASVDAVVRAKMAEVKVDYAAAFELVKAEKPDLFKAYVKK